MAFFWLSRGLGQRSFRHSLQSHRRIAKQDPRAACIGIASGSLRGEDGFAKRLGLARKQQSEKLTIHCELAAWRGDRRRCPHRDGSAVGGAEECFSETLVRE